MMKIKILIVALLFSCFSWGQTIYLNDFGTTSITTKPFVNTPTTFDANLSSSSWTTSASAFGGLAGNGGVPSQSLSLSNSSGSPTMTLTFNVASGYQLSVTQFNFWRVRSNTGAQNWAMTINGTSVGSGTIPTTGAALGVTNVSSAISGLTGTITIVMTYSGASGTGTCRIDDFTLNGTVTSTTTAPVVTSSAATAIGTTVATLNGNVTSDGGSTIIDRGFVYKTSAGVAVTDNPTSVSGTTGVFTALPTFTVNTQYFFKAYAKNGIGTTLSSPELSFFTLANTPSAPTVNNPQLTTLDVTITAGDGNPVITTYAIQEAGGLYIQSGGTLGASPFYQTAAAWGTITVTGLASSTTYTFTVIGKNGAGTATSASTGTSGTTLTPASPTIAVSPTTLTGFTYIVSSGPSAEQSFTVSGSTLSANLVVTPSTNYEISTGTGGSFVATNPITFTPSSGTVTAKTIYVRLKSGLAVNTYNGETINCTSTGAASKTVTCSGSVTVVPPTITLTSSTLNGFAYLFGYGPSAEQTFTASGSNLTASILLTPPTDYEISLTTGSGFGSTITLTPSGGTVAATTIYVRLKSGLAVASYNSETIAATSTGATTKNVTCSGSVTGPCLSQSTFTATPSGWIQTSITYATNEANFALNTGELTTLSLSNPSSLTFDLRRTNNASAKTLYVEVSTTTQGGTYTTIATYDLTNTVSAGTTNCSVDLSAYSSFSTVFIKFRKASSTTSPWYIQNVNVYCSSTPPSNPSGMISGTTPACASTTLSYSGTASNPVVNYWQTSSTGTSTSVGNASSTLNVTTSGNYYVRAYNAPMNTWSLGSVGPYAVVVSNNPAITADPVASSISYGSNTSFSVTSSGSGLTYQWQVDTTGIGTSFSNIVVSGGFYSNYTTATLTITAASNSLSGYLYRCVVSASPCAVVATSNSALLTVSVPIYFRSAIAGGAWTTAGSWEYSNDNVSWSVAVSAPDNTSTSITIRSGYNISISGGTVTADDITVDSGATLTLSGGTFVLNDGSATVDLQVNGTFTYSSGTFTQGTSGIAFSATGTYNHAIASATLTLPIATWNTSSTCNVTGMNNSLAYTAGASIGQTFGNFTWDNASQSNYVNILNSSFAVAGVMTVGPSASNQLSFASGVVATYTNTVNSLVVSGGQLNAVGTSSTENLTVTNGVTVSGAGIFVVSGGSGGATVSIGTDLSIAGGYVIVLNNTSSKSSTINIARDLLLSSTDPQLNLENVISASGVATVNVGRNFSCTSTGTTYQAVEFGTGTITNNVINIVGDFTKSGAAHFYTTSSTTISTGFAFTGTGAVQHFSYSGTDSDYTQYIVQSGAKVQLDSNLTLGTVAGTGLTPASTFTVASGGILDFTTNSIIAGTTTDPKFVALSGSTLISSNTDGFGGTTAVGSLKNFGTVGTTTTIAGRANLPAGVNYTFNGATTTPFPIPTASFGNPATIVVNATVVSNMTTNLSVTTAFTVNNGGSFKLNTANNNSLNLNTSAALTVATGGTFDNGGENQIINGGGTPTISITGTFITRDAQGFNGSNTSIPGIIPTLNTGSTVVYGGDNQLLTAISSPNPYYNLTISGTGTKTISTSSEILVGNQLNVTASTLQIDTSKLLTVTNGINNTSGNDILVLNGGNLVQITDVDNATANNNVGTIKMTRTSRSMKIYDYVYWGSPVKENILSQIPSICNLSYVWNLNGTINGAWNVPSSIVPGKGFITRFSSASASTDFNFTGTPNNGVVKTYGDSYDNGVTATSSGNTILLGNPYPSAISASSFVSDAANLNKIGGTLYFWTAITPITNLVYTTNDYATWNGTGSTAVSDVSGTNILKPTGKIASGQGFFAVLKADYDVTFNNSMRVRTTTDNSQFFRNNHSSDVAAQDSKIWLNLSNENNAFRQTLVGYVSGATNDYDNLYDGTSITNNPINIYSLLNDKSLVIQGRGLPFVASDLVPLGFKISVSGNYNIAIDHLEGVFEGDQNIYLEDKTLNIIHDIKQSPYSFYSTSGTFNDRFVLRYTNEALGNHDFETINNSVVVTTNHGDLNIKSYLETMLEVTVYDVLGRSLLEAKNIGNNDFTASNISMSQQALIVKITLNDGTVLTRKIML